MKKVFIKASILFIATISCTGAGYRGTLPDIKGEFDYLRSTPQSTKGIYDTNSTINSPNYKKIPRENKAYLDIILKKDKTSPYINDLNDVIKILEKMQKCLETNDSIQKFNAIASSIIDHADYMAKKYEEKPERFYISFAKLQYIAGEARQIATLRCESQVYIKYLLYQGEGKEYSKDNINKELADFKKDLDNAIEIMKSSR